MREEHVNIRAAGTTDANGKKLAIKYSWTVTQSTVPRMRRWWNVKQSLQKNADYVRDASGTNLDIRATFLPKSLHQSNDDPDIELVSSPIKKAKASKKKKIKIVESDVSVMHLYTDAEHKPAKGKGGVKVDPLMDLLSVNTYLKSNPKKMIARCAGAEYGCATTWAAPCWKTRVFGHALQCEKLDKIDLTLRDRVDNDDRETSDVDDDFADELEAETLDGDDNESDSNVTADPEDIAEDGSSKVDSFDSENFDAASIINLNSRKLVDVLADKDLAPAAPRSTVVLPPASTIVQERVLTEAY
ncbi:hypothetical protein DFJ58DRAFT_911484 [Suillus subalutaceus]|uniref:uncharacterized protein n=1 Tax=Suillus subalutaceus TaxID=48586 RepID=UPI001B86C45E|nr:uncharacterized protein DFJ58DRAFT_911484 [Suillus subalutaceus]KAG1868376.1 hypothetical protein DFJ58DRAFT_911484 [Suillus subalutaceus]